MQTNRLPLLLSWTLVLATVQQATAQDATAQDATASKATAHQAAEDQPPAFPDLTIPADADLEQLTELVAKAKRAQPRSPQDYKAMQSAIRQGSRQILKALEGQEDTPRYQQAELDAISAAVALMTYFSEEDQQKTVAQVHSFLKGRKPLGLPDVQTGMLAAAMLELQPNKAPARETYQLLDSLLEDDQREEMQSLRLNLQAAVRRLDLLGNRLELDAKAVDGSPIRTDDFEGQFVILDFFATWCEPCLAELPRLRKHYQRYTDKGLQVVGISLDGDPQDLEAFLDKADLPWPVIHDNHEDPLERLQMQFGVLHLPTVMLLNKQGVVVSLEARGAELDRLMEMLFEAPTPAAEPEPEAAPPPATESAEEPSKASGESTPQSPPSP